MNERECHEAARSTRVLPVVVLCCLMAGMVPARAQGVSLDRLVAAYPEFLAGQDGTDLIWKDGTRMPVSDGRTDKSYDETLRHATILDQLSLPYPKGQLTSPPARNDDPGRFRNTAFFNKMYGDCQKGAVQKTLTRIRWMPKSGGGALMVTTVNGVAERLTAVSAELDRLPAKIRAFAVPSAGTFNCRTVKDTGNPSVHAWGAAIDINTKHADYWLWRPNGAYRNRIPYEIVEIFEKHGFIWGGKWGHFDTMHFEYRPELL